MQDEGEKLPEGFQEVEFLEFRSPKRPELRQLVNFGSQREVDEIVEICKQNKIQIQSVRINGNFGLVVDERIEAFLTREQKIKYGIAKVDYPIHVNNYIPYIFRYMDSKYIDEFFSYGKLRISSFAAFAKHPHESLKDTDEGIYKGIISTGEQRVEMKMGMGL